jgi:hypothetical protein
MKTFLLKSLAFLAAGSAVALAVVSSQRLASKPPPNQCGAEPLADKVIPADLPMADLNSGEYDAYGLVMSEIAHAAQLFRREPRDPAWADVIEPQLRQFAAQQLSAVPRARVDTLECHKMTCKIVISSPSDLARKAYLRLQNPPLADTFAPGGEAYDQRGWMAQSGYLVFNRRNRDPEQQRLIYQSHLLSSEEPSP